MTDFHPGPALRDRVRDVHPDLDRLADVSLRQGTRLRRWRAVGLATGTAAGVAVIVALAWQLSPMSGPSPLGGGGFADQPSSASSSAVVSSPTLRSMVSDTPPSGSGLPPAGGAPSAERLPVHHDAIPGWTFGMPADEKFPATKGGDVLSVVVRPLSEYQGWQTSPDKTALWVSPRYQNYFVTIQGAAAATDVAELVSGLHFAPSWRQAPAGW